MKIAARVTDAALRAGAYREVFTAAARAHRAGVVGPLLDQIADPCDRIFAMIGLAEGSLDQSDGCEELHQE